MKKLLSKYFNKAWFTVLLLSFIVFVGLSGFASYQISLNSSAYSYIILYGLTGILLTAFLFALHIYTKKVENSLQEAVLEVQATPGINKLTKTPLNLGGWAISAHFLDRLMREIYHRKPNLILECGSGTSTLVTSSCLKELGEGKVISLDHLDKYASKTRDLLEIEGLEEWANVVTAPLNKYELDKGEFQWYGKEYEEYLEEQIDMLIVDGPPAGLQNLSRYPALSLLKEYLAEECLIMLDDANREDEKKIARQWSELLDAELEFNKNCRGYALIQKS